MGRSQTSEGDRTCSSREGHSPHPGSTTPRHSWLGCLPPDHQPPAYPCLQPFKMAQPPVISEEDQASSIPRLLPSPCVYLASYCLGPGGNRVCAAWHLQGATRLSECCQGRVTCGLPSMKFPGQRDHSCPFYSPRRGFQELGKEAEQSAGA